MNFVYFTATLDAAVWGAELAMGGGRGRIYLVRPTGEFEDDPNVTDKKFPGNPTQSFRSRAPLRIVGELVDWVGHPPSKLQAMLPSVVNRLWPAVARLERPSAPVASTASMHRLDRDLRADRMAAVYDRRTR